MIGVELIAVVPEAIARPENPESLPQRPVGFRAAKRCHRVDECVQVLARQLEERVRIRSEEPVDDRELVFGRDAAFVFVKEVRDVRMRAVTQDGEVRALAVRLREGQE